MKKVFVVNYAREDGGLIPRVYDTLEKALGKVESVLALFDASKTYFKIEVDDDGKSEGALFYWLVYNDGIQRTELKDDDLADAYLAIYEVEIE